MNMAVIVARKLEKQYGRGEGCFKVINGVNLTVGEKETVSIKGMSGSGKTTLLNILGGLEPATAGELFFKGTKYGTGLNSILSARERRRMGFVFQSNNLLGGFTALENVAMPCLISGMKKRESYDRAKEILNLVGLEKKFNSFPDELSGGQQQRAAIARAIVSEPEVVFADEPTGTLDPKTSELVADLMFSIKDKTGMALIVATHSDLLSERFDRRFTVCGGVLTDA